MSNSNSEIQFYVDTMIVETLLSDTSMLKRAQAGNLITSLVDAVKHYVSNNINPTDKVGSLLNILAPGAITIAFKAMGLGWLGILIGLSMRIFHIDVKSILGTIHEKIKSELSGGKQLNSSQVDNIVHGAVESHATPATEDEADQAATMMEAKSYSQNLRDAKMLKLAMIEYDLVIQGMKKESSFLSIFSDKKLRTSSLLAKVLSWIFKVAIASAGLMVAGDVVNKFIGRPNAIDNTVQKGKPITQTQMQAQAPVYVSKQNKFKLNPGYADETKNITSNWVENVSNDVPSIEAMLIMFAKQVYHGLDGLEAVIRTTPGFQVIKNKIAFYNHASAGDSMVFIPKYFTSKKQIVDMFIDDVAEKAP